MLEKFINEKKEEIEQKITSCKYPLSIEDFAALAWEHIQQKYPAETKNIDLLEAIRALKFEVSDLECKGKLHQHEWISNHEGGWIMLYKATET